MRNKIALAFGAVLLAVCFTVPALADKPVLPKASLFDVPVSSDANILTSSLTTSQGTSALRITVGIPSGQSNSIVELRVTSGAASFDLDLNNGTTLTAGRVYTFTVGVANNLSYNFQAETSTRMILTVDEVQDGSL